MQIKSTIYYYTERLFKQVRLRLCWNAKYLDYLFNFHVKMLLIESKGLVTGKGEFQNRHENHAIYLEILKSFIATNMFLIA